MTGLFGIANEFVVDSLRKPARTPGRPRVIRRVRYWSRTGVPKVVQDRRLGVSLNRVHAQKDHACAAWKGCSQGKIIESGQNYAEVRGPNRQYRRYGSFGRFPETFKYHFGCLPEDHWPMLRLLLPIKHVPPPR